VKSLSQTIPSNSDWYSGQRKEINLIHNRVSRNRRILRNVLMASALTTVLSAGGNIRPASAHAHHGVTASEGKHAHNAGGIAEASAWRHDHHQRRDIREKLLSSSHPPERHVDRSTESVHPFEGSGIASVYSDRHTASGEHMNSGAINQSINIPTFFLDMANRIGSKRA
jgi:hypothetical protein